MNSKKCFRILNQPWLQQHSKRMMAIAKERLMNCLVLFEIIISIRSLRFYFQGEICSFFGIMTPRIRMWIIVWRSTTSICGATFWCICIDVTCTMDSPTRFKRFRTVAQLNWSVNTCLDRTSFYKGDHHMVRRNLENSSLQGQFDWHWSCSMLNFYECSTSIPSICPTNSLVLSWPSWICIEFYSIPLHHHVSNIHW